MRTRDAVIWKSLAQICIFQRRRPNKRSRDASFLISLRWAFIFILNFSSEDKNQTETTFYSFTIFCDGIVLNYFCTWTVFKPCKSSFECCPSFCTYLFCQENKPSVCVCPCFIQADAFDDRQNWENALSSYKNIFTSGQFKRGSYQKQDRRGNSETFCIWGTETFGLRQTDGLASHLDSHLLPWWIYTI